MRCCNVPTFFPESFGGEGGGEGAFDERLCSPPDFCKISHTDNMDNTKVMAGFGLNDGFGGARAQP